MARGLAYGDPPKQHSCDDVLLVISVSDNGSGIPPGQERNLFRQFSQLDGGDTTHLMGSNKVDQPSETGLALNLCRRVVHLMNGHMPFLPSVAAP